MRMAITFLVLLLSLLPGVSNVQVSTNAPDDKTLGQLKKGLTEEQVVKLLGKQGRPRENSAFGHPVREFDFNGLSVYVEMEWSREDKVAYVTDVEIRRDGLTIAQREEDRSKAWSEWVQAHQRKTNVAPNKVSETTTLSTNPVVAVSEIRIGMTRDEVYKVLGNPNGWVSQGVKESATEYWTDTPTKGQLLFVFFGADGRVHGINRKRGD